MHFNYVNIQTDWFFPLNTIYRGNDIHRRVMVLESAKWFKEFLPALWMGHLLWTEFCQLISLALVFFVFGAHVEHGWPSAAIACIFFFLFFSSKSVTEKLKRYFKQNTKSCIAFRGCIFLVLFLWWFICNAA